METMEMAALKLKRCNKCGVVKSIERFSKNADCVDGHVGVCKDCRNSERKKRINDQPKLKPCFSNSELAKFTPRQLIDELKARGYTGELQFTQKIKL